jgi:putative hydrolase of the HAD superfamily
MIKVAAFDLDDTLYDEIDYCRSGFIAVAEFLTRVPEKPSAENIFDTLWKEFTSGNHSRTFNTALDTLNIKYDDKLIQKLVQVYRNHKPKITLPEDSREILPELNSRYTLALLTDGFLPVQKLKVQALGIGKYFKTTVYTEELGREFWKPSPVGFQKLMESLNCYAESMVYVADNQEKDFIGPNKLGIVSIQIVRPLGLHNKPSNLPDSAAKYRIVNLKQLPRLLNQL